MHYIITGGGGAPLSTPAESSWTIYSEKNHHFSYFAVWADSLKMKMFRTDGSVGDSIIYLAQNRPPMLCGDANWDGLVDIGDIVYLINYVFYSGPFPVGLSDVNNDEVLDIGDVVYLINYVFYGGPEPDCF